MSRAGWIKDLPIAHRGYHDLNRAVWENTLSAFSRAADAGFAIECDVQLASDSVPVIFHDDDLKRLCGVGGDVRLKTAAELAALSIGGTADRVPSLKQLLNLVAGRVPLVIEIKGRDGNPGGEDDGFAETVLEQLEDYPGKVALMSFDHHILRDLKRAGSSLPLGLTAWGDRPEDFFRHDEAMQMGLDFISYHHPHLPNDFISGQRQAGIPVITWTVRNAAEQAHSLHYADQITFEGFDPREAIAA